MTTRPTGLCLACSAVLAALALSPPRAAFGGQAGRSPVKVFILAGQSNMEGKGSVEHLEKLAEQPEYRPATAAAGTRSDRSSRSATSSATISTIRWS
jgi:hypothetical protein